MWNFEGKTSNRKEINLGGKVQTLSKQEIINRTREERRKREENRMQNRAASFIQKIYRLHLEKVRINSELRIQFDNIVNDIKLSSDPPSFDVYYQLISLICIFYDINKDLERFFYLIDIATNPFSGSDSDTDQIPYLISGFYDPTISINWPYVICTLSKLALKSFNDSKSRVLPYLIIITEKSYYKNLRENIGDITVYDFIQLSLVNKGLFTSFQESIVSDSTSTSLFIIIGRILKSNASRLTSSHKMSLTHKNFITQFLSIISLTDILSPQLFNQLSKQVSFPTLVYTLECLIKEDMLLKLMPQSTNTFTLLCNLLEIAPNLKLIKSIDLMLYVRSLSYLVSTSYKQSDFEKYSTDIDLEEDYQIEESNRPSPKRPDRRISEISSKQKASIDRLGSLDLISCIFKNITNQDDPNLKILALYLFNVITQWPKTKFRISALINRVFPTVKLSRAFVPILWTLIYPSEFIKRLESVNLELLKDKKYKDEWSILYLFLFSNDQHLSVLGDDKVDDVYGITQLTPKEFEILINILSSCIITLTLKRDDFISDTFIACTTFTLEEFKTLTISLLRKIHAKNSREKFLPDDVWLRNWSKLQNSNFSNQVASEFFDLQISNEGDDADSMDIPSKPSELCEIIQNIPFVVPFDQRVEIFSQLLFLERVRIEERAPMIFARGGEEPITIRRASVFEDGFQLLNSLGPKLKGRVSISLVNQLGMAEAGIDGGGVFKEFLNELIVKAFSPEMELFETTSDHLLYPNPSSFNRNSSRLRYYEFLGKMVGKALYEGILIDASFAHFFLSNWLTKKSYIDDLPSLDKELYNGLMVLKRYNGDVEKDFSLNFTLVDKDVTGPRTVELIPDGEKIPVTSMNKIEYIYYVADYRLNRQISKQTKAFLNGFYDILPAHWLKMFDERELQMVIGGGEQPIRVDDLEANTIYSGVYDRQHPVIVAFWQITREMDNNTLGLLVKFITSCARPPLQGFKALNPYLCIRDSGRSDDWLPTSSTCINLLKLPIYSSKEILKKKLLYAIMSESGFELS